MVLALWTGRQAVGACAGSIQDPWASPFLDTGKAIPPRLSQGTNADLRTMVPLKERANIREGSWVCVEIIADAREDKGPRGRLIPPIPEVASSKGKAQLLRPAADPLTALLETVDAVVCLSKPEAVAAIRASARRDRRSTFSPPTELTHPTPVGTSSTA